MENLNVSDVISGLAVLFIGFLCKAAWVKLTYSSFEQALRLSEMRLKKSDKKSKLHYRYKKSKLHGRKQEY